MKKLRIRLIREFKEADKFTYSGLKFRYDDLRYVWIIWRMDGRRIELRHISGTILIYRKDYSNVPLNILRASIKFLKERIKYEKAKREID